MRGKNYVPARASPPPRATQSCHRPCDVLWRPEHLLVAELLVLLVDVALVQVGRQEHEAHLTQAVIRRLSGLKSLWTIPNEWRYSTASTVSAK